MIKMQVYRSLRMRCAYRYIFAVFILFLVLVSFHLAIRSERLGIDIWPRNTLIHRHEHIKYGLHDQNRTTNNRLRLRFNRTALTWEECRKNPTMETGNPLIDNYGSNTLSKRGENGRGVELEGKEKETANALQEKYNVNVYVSDLVPLNRLVPDSRFKGCQTIPFLKALPSASIIIPFYDEWPSILLRTLYSIVNRTPRQLLQEIILVDDGSQMEELKGSLDKYIHSHFPRGLIKLIRVPQRAGLIQARLKGFRNSTGDVIIFFDSHMEVNIDWLQPLLTEVQKDRKTVALGTLDYVQQTTMEYKYYQDYMTRYGFDWRLIFFETFFRNDQIGQAPEDIRPGTVMVGAAYAIDRYYFEEIGTYDEGMKVWGGENLEMAWRIWLCGGKLVHVPCSHIGHVARSQPYTFPGGRAAIEQYNYKRAIEVWMEDEHKELVYNYFPTMRDLDVGDLSERLALKKRLKCKSFHWFMDTIWPELNVLSRNVTAWGSARNLHTSRCLDNHQYLFQAAEPLYTDICHYNYATQGFSWTKDKLLRTSLQCVVVKEPQLPGSRPLLEDCIIGPRDTWDHRQGSYLKHIKSGLCLDLDETGPVMNNCNATVITQFWQFNTYVDT